MSKSQFIIVPEWQGSSSSRAMRLVDGANAILGDLPQSATRVVEIPTGAGDMVETGIARFTSLQSVRRAQARVLAETPEPAITIGGDCGVELAAVEAAHARHLGSMALVWLDAHADLNTPQTSPSGTFHGMVLRALMGEAAPGLIPESGHELLAEMVVLAGVRALDDAEDEFIASAGITVLTPAQLTDPQSLVRAIENTGATSVYLHVDLDVLDPSDIAGVTYPEPFGVSASDLTALIRAVRGRFPLVGAGITEFAPASPNQAADDLPTILRVIGALTS
ncbi:arginase family protein [Homoserinimonas sp. OAct 916]|uniref:arginase family protein n=1 Tax=Homoserinimonas sp. OAct 916 TaxID=2211450 RepID=UPI001E3285D8|nr:arginase family protein [Homoserinimonas sp. OAct 916]